MTISNLTGPDLVPCEQCNDYYYKMPSMDICSRCKLANKLTE